MRRQLTIVGLAAAGGIGYYLYAAGGRPRAAEKEFEHDISRLSTKVRGSMPGREEANKTKDFKKQGEEWGQKAGAKIDHTMDEARGKLREADAKAEKYRKDSVARFDQMKKETGTDLKDSIDKFDATVEKKASDAKRGIWGWFSGK